MPIKICKTSTGKTGKKWGNHGKCYSGNNAKSKAQKQARAAYANGYKKK